MDPPPLLSTPGEENEWRERELAELESMKAAPAQALDESVWRFTDQESSQAHHKRMPLRTALGTHFGHRGDSVLGRAQAVKLIGWYFIMKAP